jgi:hypothetical protein
MREDQVSRSLILESFTFRVFVQQGQNPTFFRVFKDSINRLVNTEKHIHDFGEKFTALKEAIFPGLFFSLYFILGR